MYQSIEFYIILAFVATFFYATGFIHSRQKYVTTLGRCIYQLNYWKYRYITTLNDYYQLVDEKHWYKNWCPKEEDMN
jgi:hypothetical protein